MADGNLSKRIKEKLQPELDRMLADHDRFMQAAAEMPPPTEAQSAPSLKRIAPRYGSAPWMRWKLKFTEPENVRCRFGQWQFGLA